MASPLLRAGLTGTEDAEDKVAAEEEEEEVGPSPSPESMSSIIMNVDPLRCLPAAPAEEGVVVVKDEEARAEERTPLLWLA